MRIGFTGTNWTGKSTTIELVKDNYLKEEISIISLSEIISKCPYPTILDQTIDTSNWMIDKVAQILEDKNIYEMEVFDRTPIDILAFTFYVRDKDNIQISDNFIRKIKNSISKFDIIFYLPLAKDWPIRITNPKIPIEFAKLIDQYMIESITYFDKDIDIHRLSWNLEERVAEIISILGVSQKYE